MYISAVVLLYLCCSNLTKMKIVYTYVGQTLVKRRPQYPAVTNVFSHSDQVANRPY